MCMLAAKMSMSSMAQEGVARQFVSLIRHQAKFYEDHQLTLGISYGAHRRSCSLFFWPTFFGWTIRG